MYLLFPSAKSLHGWESETACSKQLKWKTPNVRWQLPAALTRGNRGFGELAGTLRAIQHRKPDDTLEAMSQVASCPYFETAA